MPCWHSAVVAEHYEDDEDPYSSMAWQVTIKAPAPRPSTPPPHPPVAPGHVARDDEIPDQIYVPVFPIGKARHAQLLLELWENGGDSAIAVGYAKLSTLVAQLGDAQPRAMMTTERFRPLLAGGVN